MNRASTRPLGISDARLGSGTSWLPDSSVVHAIHRSFGAWSLMIHGSAFGQYDQQNGFRGDRQVGLIDSEMLVGTRALVGGLLRLGVSTSLQPLVVDSRGYPQLLQTGGAYHGARLVNRQHPHDLWAELSAAYDRSVTSDLAWSVYAAAVGEPSLGPVAYMHRPSAAEDPFAPIGHHWQDAAHASHGVVTAGVYGRAFKLEASAFNGREPDEYRFNLDYHGARLDSYSARVTAAPTGTVTVSGWGGYVYAHDPLDTPTGMQRYGASILTSHRSPTGRPWSSGIVWGLNIHHHGSREHTHGSDSLAKTYHVSSAALIETSLQATDRLTIYGRAEQGQKTADDLGFVGDQPMQMFTVRTLSLGATRDLRTCDGIAVGLGARGAVNFLPRTLRLAYGTLTPIGFSVYLRVRPG